MILSKNMKIKFHNNLDLSKFLYCRNCEMKTHHYRDLKYDWGYSCRICQTWQHQSQLISIQQGYAAKAIIEALGSEYISYCDGTLEEFIEAAQALDMEYDYQKTVDSVGAASPRVAVASHRASGYDFKAWYLDDEENTAKIQL